MRVELGEPIGIEHEIDEQHGAELRRDAALVTSGGAAGATSRTSVVTGIVDQSDG